METKKKYNKIVRLIIIQLVSSVFFTFLVMLYQKKYDLLGAINGMQVTGFVLIAIGWFVFINHHGIFDVAIYGLKSFFKGFTKDPKMEKSLYEIRLSRKEMPKYLFISFWIFGILIVVLSYILYYSYL